MNYPPIPLKHPHDKTSRYYEICREISRYRGQAAKININPRLLHMVCSWLDTAIGRENRLHFFRNAYGRDIKTSNELTPQEAFGLIMWCNPYKPDSLVKSTWRGGEHWAEDLDILRWKFGQLELALPDPTQTGEQA